MTHEKQQMLRYLRNGNVELRCIDSMSHEAKKSKRGKLIWAGVYSDYDCIREAIMVANHAGYDIYQTINPINRPADNKPLQTFLKTTKDDDIFSVNTIFFDFDGKREKGIAANEAQVSACVDMAVEMSEYLDLEHGWLIPTLGLSGNGAHLYYQTCMHKNDAKKYLKGLYLALQKRFESDYVKFDLTVKNPARIARCLGTLNNKAGKRSECVYSDDFIEPLIIINTAVKLTPPPTKKHWVKPASTQEKQGRYIKHWDIVGMFTGRGMYIGERDGVHDVVCPWHGLHSSDGASDTGVWPGVWPSFHCFHNSCEGKDISDVITYFEN